MKITASLSAEQVEQFHERGFLSVPTITTAEEVAWIRGMYDSLFDRRAGWESGDFYDFAGVDHGAAVLPQLLEPSRYEPALKQTLFRTNAHAIAMQLLGPSAELVFEHAMMKPARTGGETPWHQDEAFFPKFTNYHSITFWMPLQHVDTRNGCLDFIPASHKRPILPHRSIGDDPRIHGLEALGADGASKVSCPLQEGGATIHHFRTLHHAGPNLSDEPRRAYALGFGVRSREYTVREEFPWNAQKATARKLRADASTTTLQRTIRRLKDSAKSMLLGI